MATQVTPTRRFPGDFRPLVDGVATRDFGDDHGLVPIADSLSADNTRRKRRGGRLGDPTPDATNQTLWRTAA